jgi:hypothetical protein
MLCESQVLLVPTSAEVDNSMRSWSAMNAQSRWEAKTFSRLKGQKQCWLRYWVTQPSLPEVYHFKQGLPVRSTSTKNPPQSDVFYGP